MRMFGREMERAALQQALGEDNKEWIWITGETGSGLSTLLGGIQHHDDDDEYFVQRAPRKIAWINTEFRCMGGGGGGGGSSSCFLLQSALEQLLRLKNKNDDDSFNLNSTVDGEFGLLRGKSCLTELSSEFLKNDGEENKQKTKNDSIYSSVNNVHKLQVTVKLLLREITEITQNKVVWAIDNFHLADDPKTAVNSLVSLIPDVTIVATATEAEAGNIADSITFNCYDSCIIHLNGLSKPALRNLINIYWSEAAEQDIRVLLETSQGNPLFLMELLQDLKRPEPGISSIEELWTRRIQKLPKPAKTVVEYAVCLQPHPIDLELLSLLLVDSNDSDADVESHLSTAESSGLLTRDDETEGWQLARSGIAKTVYSSLGPNERSSLHYKIGRRLWRGQQQGQNDGSGDSIKNLNVIVDQLLLGKDCLKGEENIFVASLCLQAGRTTAARSKLFPEASKYLFHGIALLNPRSWRDEYDLCLGLYDAAAEVCYCCSEFQRIKELVDVVQLNARCYNDTLSIRQTYIFSLSSQSRADEAIDLGLETLSKLNEILPTRPSMFNVVLALARTKWLLRGRSDTSLLRLPPMTDLTKITCMKICNLVLLASYLKRPLLAPILIARMIRLTVKYGYCDASSYVFSLWGMILCTAMSEVDEGYRYGKLSLAMFEMYQKEEHASNWLCRVYTAFYGCVAPYKESIASTREPLAKAYQCGLVTGDYEMAINAAAFIVTNSLDSKYLPKLESQTRALMDQMLMMGQTSNLKICRLHFQTVLNFLGRADGDPKLLKGEILDIDLELSETTERKDLFHSLWTKFYAMFVAYYFCDYDLAAKYSVGLDQLYKQKIAVNAIAAAGLTFYECVSLLASSHGRRKVAYVRRGLKKLDYFAKHAPMNFLGKLHLLKAELAIVTGDRLSALPEFTSAILYSREAGLVMQEALANERAGKYFLSQNETEKGASYLREALKLYQKWGGVAKVEHLRSEFPDILS